MSHVPQPTWCVKHKTYDHCEDATLAALQRRYTVSVICDNCKWCIARGCNEHEDQTGPYYKPPPRLAAPPPLDGLDRLRQIEQAARAFSDDLSPRSHEALRAALAQQETDHE